MISLIKKVIKFSTVGALLFVFNFSNATEYKVLADLPFAHANSTTNVTTYLNNLYNLIFALSAVLAVLMIVVGGFIYLSSDAISNKSNGREKIQGAVTGLIIILGAYLLLNTVNPDLVKFKLANQSVAFQTFPNFSDFVLSNKDKENITTYSAPLKEAMDTYKSYNKNRDTGFLKKIKQYQKFYNNKKKFLPILERAKALRADPNTSSADLIKIDNELLNNGLPINEEQITDLIDQIHKIDQNTKQKIQDENLDLSEQKIEYIAKKDDLLIAKRNFKTNEQALLADIESHYDAVNQQWIAFNANDEPLERINDHKKNLETYKAEVEKFLNTQGNEEIDSQKQAALDDLIQQYQEYNDFIDNVCDIYLETVANTECDSEITSQRYSDAQLKTITDKLKSKYSQYNNQNK